VGPDRLFVVADAGGIVWAITRTRFFLGEIQVNSPFEAVEAGVILKANGQKPGKENSS
jgi:hypothetical protein